MFRGWPAKLCESASPHRKHCKLACFAGATQENVSASRDCRFTYFARRFRNTSPRGRGRGPLTLCSKGDGRVRGYGLAIWSARPVSLDALYEALADPP
jgi:hypothetical protein